MASIGDVVQRATEEARRRDQEQVENPLVEEPIDPLQTNPAVDAARDSLSNNIEAPPPITDLQNATMEQFQYYGPSIAGYPSREDMINAFPLMKRASLNNKSYGDIASEYGRLYRIPTNPNSAAYREYYGDPASVAPMSPQYRNTVTSKLVDEKGWDSDTLRGLPMSVLQRIYNAEFPHGRYEGDSFFEDVEDFFENIGDKFGDLGETLKDIYKKGVDFAQSGWENVSGAIDEAGAFLEDLGEGLQEYTFGAGLDKMNELWSETVGQLPGGDLINPFAAVKAIDDMMSQLVGFSPFTNNPLGPMTPFALITAIGSGIRNALDSADRIGDLLTTAFDEGALNDLLDLLPQEGDSAASWLARAGPKVGDLRKRAIEIAKEGRDILHEEWVETVLSPFMRQYDRIGEGTSKVHDLVKEFVEKVGPHVIPFPGNKEADLALILAYYAEKANENVTPEDLERDKPPELPPVPPVIPNAPFSEPPAQPAVPLNPVVPSQPAGPAPPPAPSVPSIEEPKVREQLPPLVEEDELGVDTGIGMGMTPEAREEYIQEARDRGLYPSEETTIGEFFGEGSTGVDPWEWYGRPQYDPVHMDPRRYVNPQTGPTLPDLEESRFEIPDLQIHPSIQRLSGIPNRTFQRSKEVYSKNLAEQYLNMDMARSVKKRRFY